MAKHRKKDRPGIQASAEAKRAAHTVLEVLSGLKGPSEAAEILSISLQRYYVLEKRGLEGLVNALEPREKGRRTASLPSRLEAAERERDRLKAEVDRMHSLVRLTQRAVGLSSRKGKAGEKTGKGKKRKRRKVNRTRKVLALLENGEGRPVGGEPKAAQKKAGAKE